MFRGWWRRSPVFSCSIFLVLLASAACTSTRLTSYRDPAFKDVAYQSVVVAADVGDLDWREHLEGGIANQLRGLGVEAWPSLRFVSPTWPPEEQAKALRETGHPAVVLVSVGNSGVSQSFSVVSGTGYTSDQPWASMTTRLQDMKTGRVAWMATSQTEGDGFTSFDDVRRAYCLRVAKELVQQGLVQVHRVSGRGASK